MACAKVTNSQKRNNDAAPVTRPEDYRFQFGMLIGAGSETIIDSVVMRTVLDYFRAALAEDAVRRPQLP
jgi:hypothetical protein